MGLPSYPGRARDAEGESEGSTKASGTRLNPVAPKLPPPARIPREALMLATLTPAGVPPPVSPSDLEVIERISLVSAHPSQQPSLPPPLARFGRYDVLGRIAMGGMAEIYLARESVEGGAMRHAAIKVLRCEPAAKVGERYFEELFLREGRTAAQLVHPNICHVIEFGKWGGHFFIAMEWVDGVALSSVMQRAASRKKPMPAPIAATIAAQVAGALDYAHFAKDARRRPLGVVHRDVNPANIMIRHDGVVKLLDFGVAQVADPQADSRSDTLKGKLGYMAPEQARREPLDGRADVFSLGVCLYEMLTGKRLYRRDTLPETVAAVLNGPVPSIRSIDPTLPEALDVVVQRALAKGAADRWESAGAMQAALEKYLAQVGEVVSTRRIGELMATLYPDARTAAPALYTGDEVALRLAPIDVPNPRVTPLAPPASAAPVPKRVPWPAVVALAALVAGALFLAAQRPATPLPTAAQPTAEQNVTAVAPTAMRPAAPVVEPIAEPPTQDPAPSAVVAPQPSAPEVVPPAPTQHEENRGTRRRPSPGFVADPGF